MCFRNKKIEKYESNVIEATVIRNYLDWVTSIPWNNPDKISKNINQASTILKNDHYGLDKVKRNFEYLAVRKLKDQYYVCWIPGW